MSMRENLAEWRDWDDAAHAYGLALGIFDGASQRQIRRVVLSENPLGHALHDGMLALVAAGVVDRREEPDEQFRWIFEGPESLPGAREAAQADAMPTALNLDLSAGPPTNPEPVRRSWWKRDGR